MVVFLIFSSQIFIITLKASWLRLNGLNQTFLASKSIMQLIKTIFSYSATFIENQRVKNRLCSWRVFLWANCFYSWPRAARLPLWGEQSHHSLARGLLWPSIVGQNLEWAVNLFDDTAPFDDRIFKKISILEIQYGYPSYIYTKHWTQPTMLNMNSKYLNQTFCVMFH